MYYRSKLTGKIMGEIPLSYMDDIYGKGFSDKAVIGFAVEKIENPSIIDCIRNGIGIVGILRYRDLHPNCTILEAKKAVEAIEKDIRKLHEKKDK